MMVSISVSHLAAILREAVDLGARQTLIAQGVLTPYINKSQAIKLYGKANIERWMTERLITPIKDGNTGSSMYRFSRIDLECVAKASNRATYLTVEERYEAKGHKKSLS